MNEMEIFERLDKECKPDSTPIPNKIFDLWKGEEAIECWGLFIQVLGEAFQAMRGTEGKTNWYCDVSFFSSAEKVGKKNVKTIPEILIILERLKELNCIKSFTREKDLIMAKVNAEFLYEFDN